MGGFHTDGKCNGRIRQKEIIQAQLRGEAVFVGEGYRNFLPAALKDKSNVITRKGHTKKGKHHHKAL